MLSLRNFFPMNQTFVLDGRHITWYLWYIGCALQTLKVDKIKWMVKKVSFPFLSSDLKLKMVEIK